MEEIEFRAWDKLFKKMRYNVERDSDGATIYSGVVRISVNSFHDLLTQKLCLNPDNEVTEELRFIPMQYTGRKDKNDKKIYKGDIWERDGYIAIVVFEYSAWQFRKAPASSWYSYPSFHNNACYGEIIGNIHENPELQEAI